MILYAISLIAWVPVKEGIDANVESEIRPLASSKLQ